MMVDASPKSSSVRWLGEIPEHWQRVPLKLLSRIETGSTPSRADSTNFVVDGIPWVKPNDLGSTTPITGSAETLPPDSIAPNSAIPTGSVLVCGIGSIGKLGIAGCPVVTNQQINSVIFSSKLWDERFGYYCLIAAEGEFVANSNKVVLAILNKTSMGRVLMPVPPLCEQRAIAAFLDSETAKIDLLIEKLVGKNWAASIDARIVGGMLGSMFERRSALIKAAVTGKNEVTAAAKAMA